MIGALLSRLAPPAPVRVPHPARTGKGQGPAGAAPGRGRRARLRDWAELLRVSALFTVPGDALAGAAAAGLRPNRGTAYAVGASLCLYEAGMALNDWADRDEDAVDRPHRPLPSGRVSPTAALGAAGVLTAAGLAFAARAGRPALAVATALAATVWAYDLRLKHTPAAPAAMAAARGLDLLLGATATVSAPTATRPRRTAAGTAPSARAHGPLPQRSGAAAPSGPHPAAPAAPALTGSALIGAVLTGPDAGTPRGGAAARGGGPRPSMSRQRREHGAGWGGRPPATPGPALRTAAPAAAALAAHTYAVTAVSRHEAHGGSTLTPLAACGATTALGLLLARTPATAGLLPALPAAAYVRTAAVPCLHAALNPSPTLTQRAVGGGIRAMIPLQAALAARSGAGVSALAVLGLAPLARTLARKVSPT
ncbi:UbiA family prenyltransferase [Streptomyces sp. NPDC006527]|uniref:UbiA family prenyltransferase n=1 Tax=Streptomyces sp. NPDC006527 TaxID=3364749 RepID=UPI0036A3583D